PSDPRFRLVHEGRRGSYAARNAGAAVAIGDVLAFTDSDCLPRADWLRAGVAVLYGDLRPDAVGGAIEMVFRNGKAPESGPEHYDAYDGLPQQEHFITTYPFAATANMFVRAEAFRAAGPFDAAFTSGGDREWGARLAAIGGRFAYAPGAVVDHPTRPTWAELTRKSRRIAHGMADLDAAQPVHAALLGIAVEALGGLYFYIELWTWDQPSRASQKLAFAAAYWWARGLRTAIRLRRLLLRGMPGRRAAPTTTGAPSR
ncbi:glycosyltransferase, partial [Georgenia sp. 10Sc9-8]|nr:glycosyltransferase [Georgenia halotolerans]